MSLPDFWLPSTVVILIWDPNAPLPGCEFTRHHQDDMELLLKLGGIPLKPLTSHCLWAKASHLHMLIFSFFSTKNKRCFFTCFFMCFLGWDGWGEKKHPPKFEKKSHRKVWSLKVSPFNTIFLGWGFNELNLQVQLLAGANMCKRQVFGQSLHK